MNGWSTARLGDVAAFARSTVAPESIVSGSLYVGLENIDSNGKFVDVGPVQSGDLASSKFSFTPQHILYGKLRPYLAKVALPQFSGICSTDVLPIAPNSRVDRRFLAHYLRHPDIVELATRRSSGVNLPRISPRVLAEFEVPVPPLDQQKRIAAILDAAEALREKRRISLAHLGALRRSVFSDMFGDPAKNPKGWTRTLLGNLITVGPQNGLYRPASDYGSGTPIVRIDAFYDGLYGSGDTQESPRFRRGARTVIACALTRL